jgi:hypothetical protein
VRNLQHHNVEKKVKAELDLKERQRKAEREPVVWLSLFLLATSDESSNASARRDLDLQRSGMSWQSCSECTDFLHGLTAASLVINLRFQPSLEIIETNFPGTAQ